MGGYCRRSSLTPSTPLRSTEYLIRVVNVVTLSWPERARRPSIEGHLILRTPSVLASACLIIAASLIGIPASADPAETIPNSALLSGVVSQEVVDREVVDRDVVEPEIGRAHV